MCGGHKAGCQARFRTGKEFPHQTFLEVWLWEEFTYAQGKAEWSLFFFFKDNFKFLKRLTLV